MYPTDTVWGIGCDATNEDAVARIFQLKRREDTKSMIVLVAEERDVLYYTASPDLSVFNFIQEQDRPTTVIYEHALHLPDNLTAADGSIANRNARTDRHDAVGPGSREHEAIQIDRHIIGIDRDPILPDCAGKVPRQVIRTRGSDRER